MKTKEEVQEHINQCVTNFNEAKAAIGNAGDIEDNLDAVEAMKLASACIVALEWVISED